MLMTTSIIDSFCASQITSKYTPLKLPQIYCKFKIKPVRLLAIYPLSNEYLVIIIWEKKGLVWNHKAKKKPNQKSLSNLVKLYSIN